MEVPINDKIGDADGAHIQVSSIFDGAFRTLTVADACMCQGVCKYTLVTKLATLTGHTYR